MQAAKRPKGRAPRAPGRDASQIRTALPACAAGFYENTARTPLSALLPESALRRRRPATPLLLFWAGFAQFVSAETAAASAAEEQNVPAQVIAIQGTNWWIAPRG